VKNIDTLIDDIYKILDEGVVNEDPRAYETYGEEQAKILGERLAPRGEYRPTIRLSSVGKPCLRQLWYELHTPGTGEPLRPFTKLKFLYGDGIEGLLLGLARAAGHDVRGEQDPIHVEGIKGHRDCVIDGMLVDVKSASPFSFKKFDSGLRSKEDSFGYLTQLGSYLLGSQDDPLVTYKNEAAFLVMDKVSGHLCLDRHTFSEEDFNAIIGTIISRTERLSDTSLAPDRGFESFAEGKSGNRKLGVNCSYCPFKTHCWPNLRTFMYSGGRPMFLTHVERVPNVLEVTDDV